MISNHANMCRLNTSLRINPLSSIAMVGSSLPVMGSNMVLERDARRCRYSLRIVVSNVLACWTQVLYLDERARVVRFLPDADSDSEPQLFVFERIPAEAEEEDDEVGAPAQESCGWGMYVVLCDHHATAEMATSGIFLSPDDVMRGASGTAGAAAVLGRAGRSADAELRMASRWRMQEVQEEEAAIRLRLAHAGGGGGGSCKSPLAGACRRRRRRMGKRRRRERSSRRGGCPSCAALAAAAGRARAWPRRPSAASVRRRPLRPRSSRRPAAGAAGQRPRRPPLSALLLCSAHFPSPDVYHPHSAAAGALSEHHGQRMRV